MSIAVSEILWNDCIDLARNIGGIDDDFLASATDITLPATIIEIREEARKLLDNVR